MISDRRKWNQRTIKMVVAKGAFFFFVCFVFFFCDARLQFNPIEKLSCVATAPVLPGRCGISVAFVRLLST